MDRGVIAMDPTSPFPLNTWITSVVIFMAVSVANRTDHFSRFTS
jgi:hypothetical protein